MIKQFASPAYNFQEASSGMVVFCVGFEVFGEIVQPIGQNGDLYFRRTRICVVGLEVSDDAGFYFLV